MTLSRPRAVLFDLDGTLINTAPEFIHIAAELRREASLPVMDTQTIWHSVSDGAIGMVQAALEISASDPSFEFWRQRFLDHYESGLGSLSDTIFIGDHRRDIDAGIASGCQTIAASYGYLADGESAQDRGADAIATSSLALRNLIEGLLA